jgi:hypothetical protein
MKRIRIRLPAGFALSTLALMLTVALEGSDARAVPPFYSIDFHIISAGGRSLHGSCFRLSGTVGQAAPGYSSGSIYALIAGYWQPVPAATSDEIFFNGFEGCST